MAFGIATEIGFEKSLEAAILDKLKDQPEIANKIIDFTHSTLAHVQRGVIGGTGIIMLIWAVVMLMACTVTLEEKPKSKPGKSTDCIVKVIRTGFKGMPSSVGKFTIHCTGIPIFATVCIAHVFTHGLLRHRLCLLQIWDAGIVKSEFFNRTRYNSAALIWIII